MPEDQLPAPPLSADQFRDLAYTFTALPPRHDQLAPRLEFAASLLAAAGPLPQEPLLLWREGQGPIKSAPIGPRLTVGRRADSNDLAFPDDRALSKTHFTIDSSSCGCELQDLASKNGTAVNDPERTVLKKYLCDADLIFAGNQVFVFLDPRRGA